MPKAPRVDSRSAKQLLQEMREIAQRHQVAPLQGPFSAALLQVFTRYCEIIIERLNQVPDKNHLAFLNLLSVSQAPPSPARAPLTFMPVKRLPASGAPLVPAHTKVAASGGGPEPVVFETDQDLALTAARLSRIIVHDPSADLLADRSAWAAPEGGGAADAFVGDSPVEHAVYIEDSAIFGTPGLAELRLRVDIANHPAPSCGDALEWRIPTPDGADIVLKPVEDTTAQLRRSGEVVFKDLPPWPKRRIFARKGCWLICRWKKRLAGAAALGPAFSSELPVVRGLRLEARGKIDVSPIKLAFCNNLPLDVSKAFFPFGERPRFGDVLYLGSEAFARPGASITLQIKLHNPASTQLQSGIRPVYAEGKPKIVWEMWDGERWAPVATLDQTGVLTRDGTVSLTPAGPVAKCPVGGQEGHWLRARLIAGHYGEDELIEYVASDQPGQGIRRVPSTLAPPVIETLTVAGATLLRADRPEWISTCNGLSVEPVDLARQDSFLPFVASRGPRPSLYLGFERPQEEVLNASVLDLYVQLGDPPGRRYSRDDSVRLGPALLWQAWNGQEWEDLKVDDGTSGFAVSGMLRLYLKAAVAPWSQCVFGGDLYWVRVIGPSAGSSPPVLLRRISLNTAPATHTVTVCDELLGTGNGIAGQSLRAAHAPIVGEVWIDVREEIPVSGQAGRGGEVAGGEYSGLEREAKGNTTAVWVRWREVGDFLTSTPDDRHFTVDRLTGEIRFGDGLRGRILPNLPNNIRLTRYQFGGGALGNQPKGSLSRLRTTVPFVAAVTNLEPAAGGQDAEFLAAARVRGGLWLRHRDRAVTAEDYEDLAVKASPGVARAKCFPARNLLEDTQGESPGTVSVIVVPWQDGSDPKPSVRLLDDVRQFLLRYSPPEIDLITLAPDYVRVFVALSVAFSPASSDCLKACERRLQAFLHPLTGGRRQRGWEFGQMPQQSDFHGLFEGVEGLECVRSLTFRLQEERPGALKSGTFLVCGGEHRVDRVA